MHQVCILHTMPTLDPAIHMHPALSVHHTAYAQAQYIHEVTIKHPLHIVQGPAGV